MKVTPILIAFFILGLFLESYSQPNEFFFDGNADVVLRYPPRGSGGRALVHDSGNTLTLNYGGDFGGGIKLGNGLWVKNNGSIGIDTDNPEAGLQLGSLSAGITSKQILIPGAYNFEQFRLGQTGNGNMAAEFVNHTSTIASYGIRLLVNTDSKPGLQFQYSPEKTTYQDLNYVTAMYMDLSGNISIGTTNSYGYKLAVAGNVIAESVKVKPQSAWPDYVFDYSYKLPSLVKLQQYILANNRLPDIPDADEVRENGINLGEMNGKLLKKIEELTLYLIEKDSEIKRLKEKDMETTAQIRSLIDRIAVIEKKAR